MDPLSNVFDIDTPRKQEEESFVSSDEVERVAEMLLSRHLVLARLRDIRIAYCLQVGKDPQHGRGREAVIDTIAKAQKSPRLWESLSGWQAVVWCNERAWKVLTERQREAVVLHELLHLDVDADSGKVIVLKHDIEEFGLVAAEYGPWHGGLERFGEQLRMWGAEKVA